MLGTSSPAALVVVPTVEPALLFACRVVDNGGRLSLFITGDDDVERQAFCYALVGARDLRTDRHFRHWRTKISTGETMSHDFRQW